MKTKLFWQIPDGARKVDQLVKGLAWLLPRAALRWLVDLVTGMPDDAANVTMKLLTSQRGIWQAL